MENGEEEQSSCLNHEEDGDYIIACPGPDRARLARLRAVGLKMGADPKAGDLSAEHLRALLKEIDEKLREEEDAQK